MSLTIYVDDVSSDGGSVAVAAGTDEDGKRYRFGLDTRCAFDIITAMRETDEPVPAHVEEWQLLGGPR